MTKKNKDSISNESPTEGRSAKTSALADRLVNSMANNLNTVQRMTDEERLARDREKSQRMMKVVNTPFWILHLKDRRNARKWKRDKRKNLKKEKKKRNGFYVRT